jgi:hypothetical protein
MRRMSIARRLGIIGLCAGVTLALCIGSAAVWAAYERNEGAHSFPACFQRAAFDTVVQGLPAPRSELSLYERIEVPHEIGPCPILVAYAVSGGYIFYADGDSGRSLMGFDDYGWGYFPASPGDDLGNGSWEGPSFKALDGPWYTWSASW